MVKPADKIATYQDLYNIPDSLVGEILGGELVTHHRPAPKHARAASVLGARLLSNFDTLPDGESGGWWILDEPECHLGKDIVVPDIAGWRKTTMAELPESAWFDICPDWVFEVISPATARHDRGVKRDIYARVGVGHYWIVDPIEKFIEVIELQNQHWVLLQTAFDSQVVGLSPFEKMSFDLSAIQR